MRWCSDNKPVIVRSPEWMSTSMSLVGRGWRRWVLGVMLGLSSGFEGGEEEGRTVEMGWGRKEWVSDIRRIFKGAMVWDRGGRAGIWCVVDSSPLELIYHS